MLEAQIDWEKPWEVYSDYLPEKTSDQLLMFLMELKQRETSQVLLPLL